MENMSLSEALQSYHYLLDQNVRGKKYLVVPSKTEGSDTHSYRIVEKLDFIHYYLQAIFSKRPYERDVKRRLYQTMMHDLRVDPDLYRGLDMTEMSEAHSGAVTLIDKISIPYSDENAKLLNKIKEAFLKNCRSRKDISHSRYPHFSGKNPY